MRTLRAFAVAALLACPASMGCDPGVGSSCDPAQARCLNPQTQLICQDGQYIATPCRGPGGCAVLPNMGVACDITKNKPGDACATQEEGVASCVSDHRMIVCRVGKYAFEPCRGSAGCENSRGRAHCDKSLAEVGDPCKEEGSKACGVSGQQLMECKGGRMQPSYRCLGPAGCQAQGKLNCDMSLAEKGDPCDVTMEGAAACTPEKSGIVVCRGGRFEKDQDCPAPQVCNSSGSTRCEKPSQAL